MVLKPQAEHSSPLVQYMNPIANRDSRGFQLADSGCDPPIGQVVTGIVIESDDQNSGMMANGSHDQVMQVFEGISSRRWPDEPACAESGCLFVALSFNE